MPTAMPRGAWAASGQAPSGPTRPSGGAARIVKGAGAGAPLDHQLESARNSAKSAEQPTRISDIAATSANGKSRPLILNMCDLSLLLFDTVSGRFFYVQSCLQAKPSLPSLTPLPSNTP